MGTQAQRGLGAFVRAAVLLVVPLLLVGPSLLPGKRFLPQAPVAFEPLAAEYPAAAAAANQGSNRYTGDRLFPVLSDQLEFRRRVFAGESLAVEERQGLSLPFLGNVIHGPLLPQNVAALALPPDLAAGWLALVTLLLAGAGAWAFLAGRGVRESVCAFVALAFQGTGFGVANLHYPMKVDAALWLPWCLFALDLVRRGERRGGPLLALFAAASLVSGFPPIAGFVLAAVGLVALVRTGESLASGMRPASAARPLGAVVLALGLAIALAGAQLVPTASAALDSPRGAPTIEGVAAQSLPLATLALAAVPDAFMDPRRDPAPRSALAAWLAPDANAQTALAANGLEWNTHAGVAVFVLAMLGLASGRRAVAPLVLLLAAFGWAQGWPVVRWLYVLPGLNGGAPTRALSVAWFAWVWLAALGLEHALACTSRTRRLQALCVFALAALAFVVGHFGLPSAARIEGDLALRHDLALEEVRALLDPAWTEAALAHLAHGLSLFALGACGIALALVVHGTSDLRRRACAALFAAVLAIELAATSRHHVAPRDLGGLPVFPTSAALDAVARAADGGRVIRVVPGGVVEATGLARPNMLHAYGIADVSAYVAFNPRATERWFAAIDPSCVLGGGVLGLPRVELVDHPELDRAGVTCVLASTPLEHPRLRLVHAAPRFFVFARRNDLPREEWLREAPPLGDGDGGEPSVRRRAERAVLVGTATSLVGVFALAAWWFVARRRTAREVSA
jgi:hypothetical protein